MQHIKKSKMNHLFKVLVLFSILILTIFSCKKEDDLYGDVVVDSQLHDKLYLNAEDTMKIDNQNLVLQTELYRDFFPGVTKKNTRLIASIYIVNIDSLQISNKLDIKTLYVINKEQIWMSTPNPQEDMMPIYKVYRLSTNGPAWETNIYVDVVLAIEDLSTKKINYLIARNQLITKVE
jgi:hypothetical protein